MRARVEKGEVFAVAKVKFAISRKWSLQKIASEVFCYAKSMAKFINYSITSPQAKLHL